MSTMGDMGFASGLRDVIRDIIREEIRTGTVSYVNATVSGGLGINEGIYHTFEATIGSSTTPVLVQCGLERPGPVGTKVRLVSYRGEYFLDDVLHVPNPYNVGAPGAACYYDFAVTSLDGANPYIGTLGTQRGFYTLSNGYCMGNAIYYFGSGGSYKGTGSAYLCPLPIKIEANFFGSTITTVQDMCIGSWWCYNPGNAQAQVCSGTLQCLYNTQYCYMLWSHPWFPAPDPGYENWGPDNMAVSDSARFNIQFCYPFAC